MRRILAVSTATALALFGLTTGAQAAPAEADVRAVPGAEVVPGSYIVVLKSGKLASAVAAEHDATVLHAYQRVLNGFAASMTERKARQVAADPDVAFVQPNVVHRISDTQANPPSYGLDRIDQRNRPVNAAYTYGTTASNVHAYIIDTGIRTTHQDFGARATSGFDAVDGGAADDCNGHGTHVAGTVGGSAYGVAKGVQLVGVRVLDCEGSGTTAQVVAGIEWVTANAVKPAVANMSLGGSADTALDNAVSASIASGVSYAIAAGNGFLGLFALDACTQSPARVGTAITVSATNASDAKPSWANRGTCVDVFAPGISIPSTWNTSDTATNTISGTSMASPHVAGAAALYLATHPADSPAQVHSAIVSNATTGVVTSPGSGSPNRLLYTGAF
ncbi:subtilisin family serine protease [Actinoplanes lutulentus]|uniref:Subtilisin family serine protease n=1 Tax=Actinoplanes lutulentus TaxID=1287878 RepID=A0A327ZKK9_9ACTN|nr:S8 family peptidase [Actinoplanes lutulentus]MBB2941053.1 subtilisin family serine protease [Actinoplanes lutulentus]RAK43362.1 subtilisin family serine protease [Actinoplanes lutulentus]